MTKGVSYAAKAKRARPAPAPYKLYIHSVVGEEDKAAVEQGAWHKIQQGLIHSWYSLPKEEKAKINIRKTYSNKRCGVIIPEDNTSSLWARGVIKGLKIPNISVWDELSYRMSLVTTFVPSSVHTYGAEKVLKGAFSGHGIPERLVIKSEIPVGEKGFLIRFLVPHEVLDSLKSLGSLNTGIHQLKLKFPKSQDVRNLAKQLLGLSSG